MTFQGFISCSWGVANVGYVLICYGVCDAICSFSFGAIMKVKIVQFYNISLGHKYAFIITVAFKEVLLGAVVVA